MLPLRSFFPFDILFPVVIRLRLLRHETIKKYICRVWTEISVIVSNNVPIFVINIFI